MSDEEIKHHLLEGLRQLEMDLKLLRNYHKTRGLDTTAPYTKNTEDLLKLEYVNKSLEFGGEA